MKNLPLICLLAATITLTACNTPTKGAVLGAAAGGTVGGLAGGTTGAVIGGVAGAALGAGMSKNNVHQKHHHS